MSQKQNYILEVQNLSKNFSGVKALDQVQLKIREGEVHALMGENGAGKSTLMKILAGMLTPDSGEIVFEGTPLHSHRDLKILSAGIAMIHQEMLLVPELTVAQNIFLGKEIRRGKTWWLDDRSLNQKATELLAQVGIALDARTLMKNLSVAEMQMVEIVKAISKNAKIIIMDEPTSAISDKEVKSLFNIIADLKARGVAIIYISHKMDEIFQIADTITVLRDGKYIQTKPAAELNQDSLISLMVGRELDTMFPEHTEAKGNVLLSVQGLGRQGKFSDINFEVSAGEVLGIAGLMGAGRTEIARAIYGLDAIDTGNIFIRGQKATIKSPQDAIKNRIGYVSEDRKAVGLVLGMSVKENITLASIKKHKRGLFVDDASERTAVANMIEALRIKTPHPDQPVKNLSGGNQQKVVIAKVLLSSPEIIILDEPTRGIDVGAKFEIYKLVKDLAAQGMAVIMISSELPEILGMSDRILIMAEGKQTAILRKTEATQEIIMQYAMPQ
ncbi:putative ribose/galactose/methyl galactoside import ATP-binding protein [Adhaeribacter aerolatus]|uniref:Putative ribose/galactose/methyl galactoside import ATP-binding protein n=1 Tax=Adhaeribacter aerolatus TaxID=670289 RepID=A0A512B251_9BACT|nr:sugar ABC transporter ATP-binding protein [Adhaeribacter aerolatus]GEO06044.1 putative ribose/galactose/methyl galactoside import ATP-binding protein [Adhaeribacter aerolatus]